MKKSLVAVSVIVVLGAAWTGASWYTGKQIEQHMGEVVDNANGQLKAYLPKAGVKLSYENYQPACSAVKCVMCCVPTARIPVKMRR